MIKMKIFKRIKFNKKNDGFTLVEIMVATAIFSIVIAISIGLFVSSIQAQKYILNYQQLLSQTGYTMEYMSRSLRMAKKDNGSCVNGNYQVPLSNDSIKFLNNNNGECWRFYLYSNGNEKKLMVERNGKSYNLTSNNLRVNKFRVSVIGDSSGHQPKVTIFLDIQGVKSVAGHFPRIKIQTTVSQRDLNVY